jgi:hypothetical protein
MKPGKYEATLFDRWREESKNGIPCLVLEWETTEGHHWQRLYLSERARPMTYRALAKLGMTEEDFPEMRAYEWGEVITFPPPIEAVITVTQEQYQGKTFLKVTEARRIVDEKGGLQP